MRRAGALIGLLALVAAGCGSSGGGDNAAVSSPSTATTDTTATATTPTETTKTKTKTTKTSTTAKPPAATPTQTTPAQTTPKTTTTKSSTGIGAAVRRCKLSPLHSKSPGLVPAAFRLPHGRVVVVTKSGKGFVASLYYDQTVASAYKALKASARKGGYTVAGARIKGQKATLIFKQGKQAVAMQLTRAGTCASVTQATLSKVGGG